MNTMTTPTALTALKRLVVADFSDIQTQLAYVRTTEDWGQDWYPMPQDVYVEGFGGMAELDAWAQRHASSLGNHAPLPPYELAIIRTLQDLNMGMA